MYTLEELRKCTNFIKYLSKLSFLKRRDNISIIFCVKDALSDNSDNNSFYSHPKYLFDYICDEIGFEINLYGSFRHSYAGILKSGKVIFEKLSDTIEKEVYFRDNTFFVCSQGYKAGNYVSIKINNTEYSINESGLNIVVYDHCKNELLDSVAVNMLNQEIIMCREANCDYVKIIDNALMYKRFGINTYFFFTPVTDRITNPSEWEKYLTEKQITQGIIGRNIDELFDFSGINTCYLTKEDYKEHLSHPIRTIKYKDYCKNVYQVSDEINIDVDGNRRILETPPTFEKTIHIWGDSTGIVQEVRDSEMYSNILQKYINESDLPFGVRVINHCVSGMTYDMTVNYINDTELKSGDIIIIVYEYKKINAIERYAWENGIFIYDFQPMFDRPHNYGEVFLDRNHPNHNMYKVMADKMYQVVWDDLKENKKENDSIKTLNNSQMEELHNYLQSVQPYKKKIGSIVMNCNPFTLGHRYLIEYASNHCLWLYIFVVAENKSEFDFEDRLRLVKEGTKDLKNVTVLSSGGFIISQNTFSEYFEKSYIQDISIDPSFDVELFAKKIAPTLGINIRFAGSEPLDNITNQYNESMRNILPQYGIDFEEIQRKEVSGSVISASKVRKLIKENNYEEIKKIVPISTYEYLINRKNSL